MTPAWHREGGAGLPPKGYSPDRVTKRAVRLFTCVGCGDRAADPPAPPIGRCPCGGEYVVHRFDSDAYQRIRRFGDPRPQGGEDS